MSTDAAEAVEEATTRIARRELAGESGPAGAARAVVEDVVVREEPLEIQVGSLPVAVVMRTPGHDLELATGFLVTEGVVGRAADLASVRHCDTVPFPEAEDNVVRAVLAPGVPFDAERLRRNLYASSSCGICGKASLESALAHAPPIPPEARARVDLDVLHALPDRLREAQRVFDATGGLHAAGLFRGDGSLLVVREDVGRHNAVDKAVGWALREGPGLPAADILCVSGRVSFEIVQKALAARIPLVAAVSAPTSLAVELARRAGITLAAFVRPPRAALYAPAP